MPEPVRVVAAVIEREGRLLLCRRPSGKRHAGLWELPGGKLLPGEEVPEAARRELSEELGVEVRAVGEQLLAVPDPGSPFVVEFHRVEIAGDPVALEHEALAWVRPEELAGLELAPSDRAFADAFANREVRAAMWAQPSNDPVRPPAPERFPAHPASWYLFCPVQELRRGPLSRSFLGRQLVAFRTERGNLAVMDARCAHLGADLGYGTVQGETIQCPFHHWRYRCDGVCVSGPDPADPCPSPRLQIYPVAERHGHLFVFNGPEPLFPLPFFFGEDADELVAGQPFRYVADCTWYMNSANGFDMQHFLSVHGRKLESPCVIDSPALFALRNRYRARIVGNSWSDRFLRRCAGSTVDVSITSWGGPYMLMTADFPHAESRFLIATRPLDNGQTLCEGIVFLRRSRNALARRLWQPLSLLVRRSLTYGFVAGEARSLRSVRYNPAGLGQKDRDMIRFFEWVVSLPQSTPARR